MKWDKPIGLSGIDLGDRQIKATGILGVKTHR